MDGNCDYTLHVPAKPVMQRSQLITFQPCDYYDAQNDENPGPQTAASYRITPGVHTVHSLSISTDPLTSIWLANNL